MRATRRRQRKTDPLASLAAVRSINDKLRAALPDLILNKEKDLVRLLRAACHAQRYPPTDTKRSRPGRWKRENLLRVAGRSWIVKRPLSFASFADHYLRLLDFPSDVVEVLENGYINLFEAEQPARVVTRRLGATPGRAKRTRAALLASHLQTKASGGRLRQRVNELLRASAAASGETDADSAAEPEDLEDFDPYDSTHLFGEQLKQIGFAFREVGREDVTAEEIEELLKASGPILAILGRIQRRESRRRLSKCSPEGAGVQ